MKEKTENNLQLGLRILFVVFGFALFSIFVYTA